MNEWMEDQSPVQKILSKDFFSYCNNCEWFLWAKKKKNLVRTGKRQLSLLEPQHLDSM